MNTIRTATEQDTDAIQALYLEAFPEGENETVARLAAELLTETSAPPVLSLLAETDSAVIGHVAFSPVILGAEDRPRASILAPLAVRPAHQGQRAGSRLVEHGLRALTDGGTDVVFVYGDPAYYGRFGFSADAALPYAPPYTLQYPFGWQALALHDRGTVQAPVVVLRCVTPLRDPGLW